MRKVSNIPQQGRGCSQGLQAGVWDYGALLNQIVPASFQLPTVHLAEERIPEHTAVNFIQIHLLKGSLISKEMWKSYVNLRNGSCYSLERKLRQ